MLATSWARTEDKRFGQLYTDFFTPILTTNLQSTWWKPSLSPHTARKILTFPHSLPSSSQCHFRFFKFHAETFGLFPADCFSGCRLGEICRLPMLHGPSGYSQPCAGAAFLSAHSLCRGSAQDTLAALVSSSTLLPELHPGVSVHVFRMPRDSDQVSEHQLHRVSEAAA